MHTGRTGQKPDLPTLGERLFRSRSSQLGLFLLASLLARMSTFGDTNLHNDELLFFYFGQRMQDGALLYVDIWDRKPPGLFFLYSLIARLSHSVVSYQLAACLFVSLTAFTISLLAERFAKRLGALLAGILYIAILPVFGGGGGEAAVFLNLVMAFSGLLVMRETEHLRVGKVRPPLWFAMGCAGIAITFKQTAIFEGAFFGCFALWQIARAKLTPSHILRTGLGLALTGAAPMLIFAAYYAAAGHFTEFWHTMVTANLDKQYNPGDNLGRRALIFLAQTGPVLFIALLGLWRISRTRESELLWFLAGWLIAAVAGFVVIPNLIDHYILPLLVPLAVISSGFLQRTGSGAITGTALVALYLWVGHAFDFAEHRRSRLAMAELVEQIRRRDPEPRLFVYDGPVYLYALTKSDPPTPLVFPLHLNYLPEKNVSPYPTEAEFRKVLAWKPTVVIIRRSSEGNLRNSKIRKLTLDYVASRCHWHFTQPAYNTSGRYLLDIHGGCVELLTPHKPESAPVPR